MTTELNNLLYNLDIITLQEGTILRENTNFLQTNAEISKIYGVLCFLKYRSLCLSLCVKFQVFYRVLDRGLSYLPTPQLKTHP